MATPGQLQMYNKMEMSEMFGLDHRAFDSRIGEIRRIHIYPDEKVPDAAIFKIWLEDHTLGHILRMELLRNENVLFAGYKVPHPLDHMIELRVQTMSKSSPQTALRLAVRNLRGECKSMLEQFDIGVAALKKGERHRPEATTGVIRDRGEVSPDTDMQSSERGAGGGTSDDMVRRPEPMDEDKAFRDEAASLKALDAFGRTEEGVEGVYSPAYSPTSPHQEPPGSLTPGLTPGQSPGPMSLTPGLTPGPSPGPITGAYPTSALTPGLTPGLTPAAETPAPDAEMDD